MKLAELIEHETPPALLRLSRLAPLDSADRASLFAAMARRRRLRSRRELFSEGIEIAEPLLLTSGWAARLRLLADGRRQFLSFLLPGDLIGMCRHARPLAVSTVIALTDVTFCPAPEAESGSGLAEALAVSQALDEAYLLQHIVRLGRLNAHDRIIDLMLEFRERLALAGLLEDGNRFAFPLTQEMLADALGLTSVHINRMLQTLRRQGDLETASGWITLCNPQQLATKIDRAPLRVTAVS
jgi:CRP-like cAMP-binding protein